MSDDMDWTLRELDYEPPPVDTSVAHSARVYDYLLGGKSNYPVDRDAAEHTLEVWPGIRTTVWESRKFMRRVVRYAAEERGVDQFLDLGTGIPTSPNLHEIAQRVTPGARVVYVDNDPIVLAHAQALLRSTAAGRVAYIHADIREPDAILDSPDFRATLDLGRPVALTILTVLHMIADDDEAHRIIDRYLAPLPAGSVLALSVSTADTNPGQVTKVAATATSHGIPTRVDRSRSDAEAFFAGLELVEPGVELIHRWRPDPESARVDDADISMYGAVAVKP